MASTLFKHNEIVLLLGAGASVEAGIPDSNNMVSEIEQAVSNEDSSWWKFRDLYRYIRSSVFYADGLKGVFNENVPFNIERLVNVLDELHKKERHTLYPFVGAWNPKLVDLAGREFEYVHEFRDSIISILRNQWVALPVREKANYYDGLLRFQQEFEYPLRVFSLNYDLCIEQICGLQKVQRGFINREWDWRLFDDTSDDPLPLLLYKLHGSMDWYFKEDGKVTYSDSTSSIQNEDIALIFGTSYKLQYIDPFLFFVYELRRWTLDVARIIVCVGYGFNDEHINGILQQSLRQNRDRKLLAITSPNANEGDQLKNQITQLLNAECNQIEIRSCGAKEFFENKLSISYLAGLFPPETEIFSEL